jgi:hypothetical protein
VGSNPAAPTNDLHGRRGVIEENLTGWRERRRPSRHLQNPPARILFDRLLRIADMRCKPLILCLTLGVLTGQPQGAGAAPSFVDRFAPARQSDCEIRALAFKKRHPHMDELEFMRPGFNPFDEAVAPRPPQSYRDTTSGTMFYVESDGRHIAAIGANGRLLWVHDPFVEANLCPYRSAHPFIFWIGAPGGSRGSTYLTPFVPTPDNVANAGIVTELNQEIARGAKYVKPRDNDRFIGVNFNSSQFGYMNMRNGDFYFRGQD